MGIERDLAEEFESKKQLLEAFRDKMHSLIQDLLYLAKIKPHQITCRVKSKESLSNKVERKKGKYSELQQITDLVGVRIITYLEDEVDQIADIIAKEFEVDKENSLDRRIIDSDRFGYRSLHYVISLPTERLKFTETKIYHGLKVEIQIRSVLQHAWAEIEHDLGYKGEFEIPRFARRTFSRIAALLETADIEFVKLKDALKKYESEITSDIKNKPDKVLIDKASLLKFISESSLLTEIEQAMQVQIQSLDIRIDKEPNIELYLKILSYFKISTIKDLNSTLQVLKSQIPTFFNYYIEDKKKTLLAPKGIPIFYLGYILAAESNDVPSYFEAIGVGILPPGIIKHLISSYNNSKNSR